jgi:endogenous inhibitor of DNA gyrase (YacG/DUF329 family)
MEEVASAKPADKRNIGRLAPVTCEACGRRTARKSRQQKFCSDRCRDYAWRANKARTAIKNPVGYQGSRQPTDPRFLSNKNNELQGAKSGSSIPLNVLGGYRWPNAPKLDRHTWKNVIRREIGVVS